MNIQSPCGRKISAPTVAWLGGGFLVADETILDEYEESELILYCEMAFADWFSPEEDEAWADL